MSNEPIFHIALPDDWAAAFTFGEYAVSTRARSLDEVGFIHCSTSTQLVATANNFYGDITELVVLTIDVELVPSAIVWEPPAADVEQLFPHIYGPLPIAAVTCADFWLRQPDSPWAIAE